ncbi:26S proteasome regulatory subunit rpn-1 [Yarrowia sp. C11]|nr:26S proteasome regulatory subunit rpn-1 [Yarrowia sp. E02]KAG5371597.1 26S proteasome regulatory subunit rpn-1 [Yarrowia sp. C11]
MAAKDVVDKTIVDKNVDKNDKNAANEKNKKNARKDEEELSEEDEKLKSELEMLVERLTEKDTSLYEPSLEALKNFIRTSTSSMTAVPKPLKFLRPHYPQLSELYDTWTDEKHKQQLADVLSVLAMTYSGDGKRDALKFRLLSTTDDLGSWGHEYVRHLALEIGQEYQLQQVEGDVKGDVLPSSSDVRNLGIKLVPFFLKHNAEADAVDLLLEIEAVEHLPKYVDDTTYARVCHYMVACVPLLAPPDDVAFLHTAYAIYLAHRQLTQALALAIRLDDMDLIKSVMDAASGDELLQKQLAFILARQKCYFDVADESVQECMSNALLADHFRYLTKELNLLEPKVPEDIYKSHLENSRDIIMSGAFDSAKQNLAASFVNAFVNCAYSGDRLLTNGGADEEGEAGGASGAWIYKTKLAGMYSTTASLGSLFQWDLSRGLQQLDKYAYSSEPQIKAGALLGMGIVTAGVYDETDAAVALLADHITEEPSAENNNGNAYSLNQLSAVMGLGIAYAGSRRVDLLDMLLPLVQDTDTSMKTSAMAALSLGHIFVGSANGDVVSALLGSLLERDAIQLSDKWARFMALGLALLFIGKYEEIEEAVETVRAIEHPLGRICETLITVCAYAGTGNVLQIQKLLHDCVGEGEEGEVGGEAEGGEGGDTALPTEGGDAALPSEAEAAADAADTIEAATAADAADATTEAADATDAAADSEESSSHQAYSVLGLAIVAMGEEIGQEMVLRHFGHLMHYGDAQVKRAVPLAMGLVSASNAQMRVFDTLSRYSHDADMEVALNSIFSMGLVGAGTNNARLAQLLRQLASYYSKDPDGLFTVRIAQGLLYLGKGTLTVSPFHTDRQILSKVSLASLVTLLVTMIDPKSFILADNHWMLFWLTNAIRPRMLITLDEKLQPIKVPVRVGQAVDTVGQAGKPKTITGWVTHSTPVLLSHGERAELEDDEYIPLASSLEGVVILKKNPDRMDESS